MYNTAVRVKAVGAAFLMVLIGSYKSKQVSDTVSVHSVGDCKYPDFVHHVEAVLEALIREGDSDKSLHQTIGISSSAEECIAIVCTWISNRGVATEDYETSQADAVRSLSVSFSIVMLLILTISV